MSRLIPFALLFAFVPFLPAQEAVEIEVKKDPPTLPGLQKDGRIQLPNSWSIRPAGKHVEVGDFPVNVALHPSGKWAAILHAGYGTHEILIVDLKLKKEHIHSRVTLDQTFLGLSFSADGEYLYAGGGEFDLIHQYAFDDGYLFKHRTLKVSDTKFIPGNFAIHPNGKKIYVPGVFADAVAVVDIASAKEAAPILPLEKEAFPFGCAFDSKGKQLFVSYWNKSKVAVIDVETGKVVREFVTEQHPTEMVVGPGDKTLFVACSNSTRVSVIDLVQGKAIETINCALYPAAPSGNTPNSLALTPDGQILFVANADNNNLAMFNVETPGKARPLGYIPTGMYPTSVRYNSVDKRIYVANGRGVTTKANPHGPNPLFPAEKPRVREYIAGLYRGTLGIIDMPDEMGMVALSKRAYQCSPLRPDSSVVIERPKDNPIPAKIGEPSPIKYCIYVIRENRTYDQVFGDIPGANGSANLCIFPEKITPNAHRLAKQFVLMDNFYCDGEVSAEGHEWSMGAYCTDFVKRIWPLSYRGSVNKNLKIYPAEGKFDVATPAGGYIWNRCADAKVTYRSYGEWVQNGKTPDDPAKASAKALEGHIDPKYRAYDLEYPDTKRSARFLEELRRFEGEGDMPRMQIVRLGNDHTFGTKAGKPTPTAMVAENDLALGQLVEGISRSKFWKETAIFVIEDDAQNGSDHVDAHRTVALCISPYTQHGGVDSTMYSTASMLRTMELILGLQPMSQFDAAARPMYNAFRAEPNLKPFSHSPPGTNLRALNAKDAYGAELAEKWDFSEEDLIDDLALNDVIWRSVRGPASIMPPPVRSGFVFPRLPNPGSSKKDDDDD